MDRAGESNYGGTKKAAPLGQGRTSFARANRERLSVLISRWERPEKLSNTLERKPEDIKVVIPFAQR
jgi:hypothetical protein